MKLLAALLLSAVILQGDGGSVVLREKSGPFVISVFAAPAADGLADLTVFVQDGANQDAVLDANVTIRVEGEQPVHASRDHGQNRMLYGAYVKTPHAGRNRFSVDVARRSLIAAVAGELQAPAETGRVAQHWAVLLFPPIFVAIFVLREWLVRR